MIQQANGVVVSRRSFVLSCERNSDVNNSDRTEEDSGPFPFFVFFFVWGPRQRQGDKKLVYRLIVLFSSTEIFSKRRKIYACMKENQSCLFLCEKASWSFTLQQHVWDVWIVVTTSLYRQTSCTCVKLTRPYNCCTGSPFSSTSSFFENGGSLEAIKSAIKQSTASSESKWSAMRPMSLLNCEWKSCRFFSSANSSELLCSVSTPFTAPVLSPSSSR